MIRFLSALLGLLTLLAVGGVALLLVALEPAPSVAGSAQLPPEQMRELVNLVKQTDRAGDRARTIELTPLELNALVGLAGRRVGGSARIDAAPAGAALLASFPLGGDLGYANLRVELRETLGIPAVASAHLGALRLPASVGDWLLGRALDELSDAGELLRVDFEPERTRLSFQLRGNVKTAAFALLGDAEQQRLRVRQAQLAAAIAAPAGDPLPLARVLSAVLAEPTGVEGADGRPDPVDDNRASLVVLAFYVSGRRLAVPGAASLPLGRRVTLHGRIDLAQHFCISAAVTAEGGSDVAHMVGLAKELSDADGGSGFSFPDMLANRAGIRFAELATRSEQAALYVRRQARRGFSELNLAPRPDGLPEGMQEAVLIRTIGSPSSPAYGRLIQHIDRRIDATGLYRGVPSG